MPFSGLVPFSCGLRMYSWVPPEADSGSLRVSCFRGRRSRGTPSAVVYLVIDLPSPSDTIRSGSTMVYTIYSVLPGVWRRSFFVIILFFSLLYRFGVVGTPALNSSLGCILHLEPARVSSGLPSRLYYALIGRPSHRGLLSWSSRVKPSRFHTIDASYLLWRRYGIVRVGAGGGSVIHG